MILLGDRDDSVPSFWENGCRFVGVGFREAGMVSVRALFGSCAVRKRRSETCASC